MRLELICLDADDTLWHNMRHFAEAKDSFIADRELRGALLNAAPEGFPDLL